MSIVAMALILCLVPFQDAQKSKDPDVRRVTLKSQNVPVGSVVAQVLKETGIPIELDADAKKKLESEDFQVSILAAEITVTAAMRLLFESHGFKVVAVDKKKVLITIP